MEIRVPSPHSPAATAERVRGAARRFELIVPDEAAESDVAGTLVKETPLGAVRASWRAEPGALVVTVLEKPAFLPDGAVRRALEDGLRQVLTG